jgi:CDP-L-myo-inositol myo-inositolphosphotransferase
MEPINTRRCVLFLPPRSGTPAPIFGLEAAERTVLAFARAGVLEFVLIGDGEVAAHAAARLRAGPCARVGARVVASGAVLAGEEPCFLARGDVYCDRRLVWRFVDELAEAADTCVAVDRRPEPRRHPEALLARLHPGGGLRCAGRGLVAADAALPGLALATPSLLRRLAEAGGDERAFERALSGLAEREPVATFDVEEPWQPLVLPADLSAARRKLLAGAVALGDGLVARHLNRRLSRRITARLVSRDVKPWQVSLASFLLTMSGGASFAIGHAATGGVLAQLASVLDCVDGEIARIRYQDSPFGGVYDALLDRVGDAAVVGGMTLYAWLMGAGHSAVALGFAALAGSSLSMLVKERYGTQFRRPYHVEREGKWSWLLLGRDGRLFLALVAGLTGQVEAVLGYLAVGTHLHAGLRVLRIRAEAARA